MKYISHDILYMRECAYVEFGQMSLDYSEVEAKAQENVSDSDFSYDDDLATDLPKALKEELPALSDTRIQALTAGQAVTLPEFRSEIEGFLVYCVHDTNVTEQVLVSNSPTTGDVTDDILTPGKSVLILAQSNRIALRNTGANSHTVVVKAFRGWTPAYF